MEQARFDQAIARIDEANAEDPRTEVVDGEEVAGELLYGRRMSARLARFAPEASEALRLAARAQHVCRWRIPRDRYPTGRAGYKRWRSELARLHAELAGEILRQVGYDEKLVARVGDLLQKRRLATDAEVQTLEDVACLVFLEHYFAAFAAKHEEAKLVDILQKTWRKMSERGRAAALALELPPEARALVEKALA
jgi:hypothetical protein